MSNERQKCFLRLGTVLVTKVDHFMRNSKIKRTRRHCFLLLSGDAHNITRLKRLSVIDRDKITIQNYAFTNHCAPSPISEFASTASARKQRVPVKTSARKERVRAKSKGAPTRTNDVMSHLCKFNLAPTFQASKHDNKNNNKILTTRTANATLSRSKSGDPNLNVQSANHLGWIGEHHSFPLGCVRSPAHDTTHSINIFSKFSNASGAQTIRFSAKY